MNVMREKFEALLAKGDEGDWLGVFEGEDLSDLNTLGLRFAMLFDKADFDKAVIGKSTAPDTRFGLGWRFILKAKCRSVDEALVWFADEGEEA
jgi:hypothetical protein